MQPATAQRLLSKTVLLLLATGCVHARVERVGRGALAQGTEGLAPVVTQTEGYDEVARIYVDTDGVVTDERLTKHLLRRASLAGCDAVANVTVEGAQAHGKCLRRRLVASKREPAMTVREASSALRARAAQAGAQGRALLVALDQVQTRHGAERAWPLRWYLDTYPQSPFRADVQALFVPTYEVTGAPAPARTAQSAE